MVGFSCKEQNLTDTGWKDILYTLIHHLVSLKQGISWPLEEISALKKPMTRGIFVVVVIRLYYTT